VLTSHIGGVDVSSYFRSVPSVRLPASSFFPAIIMGIFSKRINREGAIAGMITGIMFTAGYIHYFKTINTGANTPEHWWFGISPKGIGTFGMLINFVVTIAVSRMTPPPPREIQELVEHIRLPGDPRTY